MPIRPSNCPVSMDSNLNVFIIGNRACRVGSITADGMTLNRLVLPSNSGKSSVNPVISEASDWDKTVVKDSKFTVNKLVRGTFSSLAILRPIACMPETDFHWTSCAYVSVDNMAKKNKRKNFCIEF